MQTLELLKHFIEFNMSISFVILGAFGWIVSKQINQIGRFGIPHLFAFGAFIALSFNIIEVSELIISAIKESKAGASANYTSDEIQSGLKWSIRFSIGAVFLLTCYQASLIFKLPDWKKK